jgi:predicted PurR-regulated permease PerM
VSSDGARGDGVGAVVARATGALALLAGALLVLRPFLVPMAWAGILAYATWPLYRVVRRRTRRPRLAAALFTAGVSLGVGVPVAWLLAALAAEASHGISVAREWLDAGAPAPAWIAGWPWLAERFDELRARSVVSPTEVLRYATRYAAQISSRLVDLAGGLASNVFKFAIAMVTLYVFYVDGERITAQVRRLATIAFPHARQGVLEHVGAVVRAVVFGLLGTALAQGLIAGVGFALFGVPSPVMLGALTFGSSFLPMGPTLVWGAAALWLLFGGHSYAAAGLAIYGVVLISSIDNVLRPLLISGGTTRIPFLLVFFGVLGGLMAFGVLGLFLGPVLLSVSFALIVEFAQRGDGPAVPESR